MVGVGAGTVWIGRSVVDDMGGLGLVGLEGRVDVDVGGDDGWACGDGEERDTVLVVVDRCDEDAAAFGSSDLGSGGGLVGRPEMTGGGRWRPSAAFLESWRAKSEACHHSRNFKAKMDVGKSILRLARRRGYTTDAKVLGLKILDAWPGRAPGRGVLSEAWPAKAMARWSASLSRRMRVPISQRKGEEYFELSKR